MATDLGPFDVLLGNYGLITVPRTYSRYAITPFAPRISIENPSHATLDAYQSFTINDWSHGFGFQEQLDIQGYNYSGGNIATHVPHVLQLYSNPTDHTTFAVDINAITDFNNFTYFGLDSAYGGSTLVYTDPNVDANTTVGGAGGATTSVTDLLASQNASGGDLLFVAQSKTSDIAFKTLDTSGVWATPVATAYAKYWAIAGGFMWYADRTNQVSYSDTPTTSWSALIKVGSNKHPITSIVQFAGKLYIGKTNGIYYIDPGTDIAFPAATFDDEVNANNCIGMKVWRDHLYFSVNNRLMRMHYSHTLSDVSPPRYGNAYPYIWLGDFRSFVTTRRYLYYIASDSLEEGTSQYWLCAFDGVAHHKLLPVMTTSTTSASSLAPYLRVMFFSQLYTPTRLWWATPLGSGKSTYIPIHTIPDQPYPNLPTTGTHFVETSNNPFAMPEVVKDFKDVVIEMVDSTIQGPNSPVTVVNDASVGTIAWTNPGNATTEDGIFATAVLANGQITNYLKATNFGFTVDSTASITGIKIEVKAKHNGTSGLLRSNSVKLVVGGAISGSNMRARVLTTNVLAYQFYGGPNTMGGLTLTPAQVNATDFGVAVSLIDTSAGNVTVSVDHIRITVYFSYGLATNTTQEAQGTAQVQFALDNSPVMQSLGTSSSVRTKTLSFPRADGNPTAATSTTFTDTARTEGLNYWTEATVDIVSGTGSGQSRRIVTNSAAGLFTVDSAWTTTPDTTSRYQLTWQGKLIRFRIVLSTTSVNFGPVVKSLSIRFQPRPVLKSGWQFHVKAADQLSLNSGGIQAPTDTRQTIQTLAFGWRDTKAPIQFVDKEGATFNVQVSDVKTIEVEEHPVDRGEGQGRLETLLAITLVEG